MTNRGLHNLPELAERDAQLHLRLKATADATHMQGAAVIYLLSHDFTLYCQRSFLLRGTLGGHTFLWRQ